MLPKIITLDYLKNSIEDQYLDRKSGRIKPSEIARHLVAFANANGGVLVIGIEDDGKVSGIDSDKVINEFLDIPYSHCVGKLRFSYELRNVQVDNMDKKRGICSICG